MHNQLHHEFQLLNCLSLSLGWECRTRAALKGQRSILTCSVLASMQDFWNVAAEDPLVHFARFFYGPMLQGRDGVGAAPCCGTGVVFRRDVLVSIGGQAYGSITEDYNTAMTLLGSGLSTM